MENTLFRKQTYSLSQEELELLKIGNPKTVELEYEIGDCVYKPYLCCKNNDGKYQYFLHAGIVEIDKITITKNGIHYHTTKPRRVIWASKEIFYKIKDAEQWIAENGDRIIEELKRKYNLPNEII